MGHTRGPWAAYPPEMLDSKNWSVQTDCGMTVVCGGDTPETEANARLIAAAPEMLDVCKAISFDVGSFEFTDGEYRLSEQSAGVILQALREVIAKAEGR